MTIRIPGAVNQRLYDEPWYDKTLTGADRFDVSGIPPIGSTLRGLLYLRSSVAATSDSAFFYINGDTTAANYSSSDHIGGTTHSSARSDSAQILRPPGDSSPANYFEQVEFVIFDYASSATKMVVFLEVFRRDATNMWSSNPGLHYETAGAVTQLTVQPDGYPTDNFIAGCRFRLWIEP